MKIHLTRYKMRTSSKRSKSFYLDNIEVEMEEQLTITSFTDPVCTWCWGSEPIFRALEQTYGNQIQFEFIMGGLVKDIRYNFDPANGIGGSNLGVSEIVSQVSKHWIEASNRHGMPVNVADFKVFDDNNRSSYPLNIAFKAAEMIDKEKAHTFLYLLRSASAAEGRATNELDVMLDLVSQAGLDIEAFQKHFTDGSAEGAFKKDLEEVMKNGVTGFPTYMITYKEKSIKLNGFRNLLQFMNAIDSISNGDIKKLDSLEFTKENLLSVLSGRPKLAMAEIKAIFKIDSLDKTFELVDSIVRETDIKMTRVGNSYFVELKSEDNPICDVLTGLCV